MVLEPPTVVEHQPEKIDLSDSCRDSLVGVVNMMVLIEEDLLGMKCESDP